MTHDLAHLDLDDDLATVVQKLHDALTVRELESQEGSERSAKRLFAPIGAWNRLPQQPRVLMDYNRTQEGDVLSGASSTARLSTSRDQCLQSNVLCHFTSGR